jgi:hypothetical protein
MKKVNGITIVLVAVISFIGCSTQLEIVNSSSYALDLISWVDENGKIYWFGSDLVYDYVLYQYINGLYPGSSDTKGVAPGRSPIYFWFATGGPEYHTEELVVVEKWKKRTFVLNDYTMVISTAGVTLKELQDTLETLEKTSSDDVLKRRIKQSSK